MSADASPDVLGNINIGYLPHPLSLGSTLTGMELDGGVTLDTTIHALTVLALGSASPNTTGEMEVDSTPDITVIGLGKVTLNTVGEIEVYNPQT